MYRIAIVEDDLEIQKQLTGYLKRFAQETGESFQISSFNDGREIVVNYKPIYDVILLDVQMAHLDGLSTAKRIRQFDNEVVLVFITNMSQYAIKGYEVDALSYVLKPVPYFAFSQEIKRSLDKVRKRKNRYLVIPSEEGMIRVDVRDILFIESMKHRITIHMMNQDYSLVGTMKEMEEKLEKADFFRCNSGYLVNLAHVKGIRDTSALVGSYELQISRPRRKAFLESLTNYLGGDI